MKSLRVPRGPYRLTIRRDGAGVPHIEADSLRGALFGLGYMHALDRATQLFFSRSMALGRAAEHIAGTAELVDTDRFFRRIGLHIDTETEYRTLPSAIQDRIDAYAAGVNHGVRHHRRTLPMWVTGFLPGPWDGLSVMLIGKLLSFGGLAIGQLQNERLLIEMIHAGVGERALRDLFGERIRDADFNLIRRVRMANPLSDAALELLTDLPRLAGSNAWAVAPHRSATGNALLAGDPHLEVNRLPAIWYEAVLRWPDRYVMGATLPGCPLFAVARTDRLAWSVTYMKGDTIDYFLEDCRPGGRSGWQYRRGDRWRDFRLRTEPILRKGSAAAEPMPVFENDVGVLETEPEEPGIYLSVAWTGRHAGNGRAMATWLEMLDARSVREGMARAARCTQPTLVWIMADRDGHIGLQGCGRFPVRAPDRLGLAPIPAWDAENHWQGWRAVEDLPSLYDPPQGFVATANEELAPASGPPLITQPLPEYRWQRIVDVLGTTSRLTLEDMQRLQYDVVSTRAHRLLGKLLPLAPDSPVKTQLDAWDGSYDPQSRGAALFLRWYRNLLLELLGHERGVGWRRMLYLCSRAGFSLMVITAADRLLLRDESVWWEAQGKAAIVAAATRKLEGFDPPPWSEVNNFHFCNRFFGQHRVGRILGYRSHRYAMPGNHATVFQGHVLQTAKRESTFAPSYHFVTDMGRDEAWTNLPGGPSESRFSRYYASDIPRWLEGRYKRLTSEHELLRTDG